MAVLSLMFSQGGMFCENKADKKTNKPPIHPEDG